ncbi:hypothetical protein NC652_024738 [Populus alba x Populus x berolinensis]|nr:hypothetical protein NC652_024738 [Populus alba x Populus x berolinensis]
MLSKESGGSAFDLPEDVLQVLPSDPFQQLDVARKITSIALSTRVSALESESSLLRAKLAEKDDFIAHLQAQIESLDSSLSDSSDKLSRATQEKESLLKENASLSNTVKKLQRDVSKLEVFRKTLVQSLREDEESSVSYPTDLFWLMNNVLSLLLQENCCEIMYGGFRVMLILFCGRQELHRSLPSLHQMKMMPLCHLQDILQYKARFQKWENSFAEDREDRWYATTPRPGLSQILLASQINTPRFTPPGSPPSFSASVSPTRTSKPVSPKRQSMSFSITRSMDDRSSAFSSMSSSQHSSMSSDAGSQAGRTRVDGKEFFRQVRTRLSYEQFGAFLANVKELNSHKQTKEETLRKAEEIFGSDNKDLYTIFEGLITRNVH